MSDGFSPTKPDWTSPTEQDRKDARKKGAQLKQTGILVCGSSVAVFLPVLLMLQRRGISPIVFYVLFACWFMDVAFGLWFIIRGNKLLRQGSKSNG
jgi:hypothetical protein